MFKKLITQLLNKFSWSDFLAARDEIEIKKDVDLEPIDLAKPVKKLEKIISKEFAAYIVIMYILGVVLGIWVAS